MMRRPLPQRILLFTLAAAGAAMAEPVVTGLQPSATTAGAPAFSLIVNGRGFTYLTRITWDGTVLPTRIESETRAVAEVPSARLLKAGTATVAAVQDKATSDPAVFTINPPLEWITAPVLPPASLRGFYSQALTVSGGTPPVRYSLAGGAVPAGLHLDGFNGSIVGYPTAAGDSEFTVRASDASGVTVALAFKLSVAGELQVKSGPALPPAIVGREYSTTLEAVGAVPPLADWAVTVGALPRGLALDAKSGRIGGTASAVVRQVFTVRVRDGSGRTASRELTLAAISTPTLNWTMLPGGYAVGDSVDQALTAQGGQPPYTWILAEGQLPAGLLLDERSGRVRGTLAQPGNSRAVIQVRDSLGLEAKATIELTVAPGLEVVTGPAPAASLGNDYALTLNARGGAPPYTWRISEGELPGGMRLESGRVIGRAERPGRFEFTASVADRGGRTAAGRWQIEVSTPVLPVLTLSAPETIGPLRQESVTVRADRAYPADLEIELTLRFEPSSSPGPDDPGVLLSGGGRTARLRLPAGQVTASPAVRFQSGTTAGNIVWSTRTGLAGSAAVATDSGKTSVFAGPPAVQSLKVQRTPEGLEAIVVAYSPTRQIDSAVFGFDDSIELTVPLERVSGDWYASEASTPHGTLFVYRQTFSLKGDASRLRGVSLILRNSAGSSIPLSTAF